MPSVSGSLESPPPESSEVALQAPSRERGDGEQGGG